MNTGFTDHMDRRLWAFSWGYVGYPFEYPEDPAFFWATAQEVELAWAVVSALGKLANWGVVAASWVQVPK